VVHEKKKSLSQLYGEEKLGDLGLKTREYSTPNLRQGLQVSDNANVANLGKKPLKVTFEDVSPNLSISVSPNPIPKGETAKMTFTVTADRGLWGKNAYSATPVLNGKKANGSITVYTSTQENFSLLTEKERENAPLPMFTSSTYDFGIVKLGSIVKGEFTVQNKGKSPLHFYKADSEDPALTITLPADVPASKTGKVSFILDTSKLPAGESVTMVSITTNSPLRPVVNIFVAGILKESGI